jgi:hypothetical protein
MQSLQFDHQVTVILHDDKSSKENVIDCEDEAKKSFVGKNSIKSEF